MRRSSPSIPASRNAFWRLGALVVLSAATLLAPKMAKAGLTPLDESEMSAVRGQAALQFHQDSSDLKNDLSKLPIAGLLVGGLSPQDLHLSLLDRQGFESAMAAKGLALDSSFYDGRPVLQVAIDAAPFTVSFDASRLFLAGTGLQYHGPSMGTITLQNVDMRGTTLYVFGH